jgi:hypothetical protein
VEQFSNRYTCKFGVGEFSGTHLDGKSKQDVKQIIFTKGASDIPLDLFKTFPNIEVLRASECGLTKFNGNCLQGATQLKELYLTGNEITSLESKSFVNAPNLVYLDLATNKFTDFAEHTFGGLSSLIYLDLSNNYLDHLDAKYFSDIPDIKAIQIANNKVKALTKDIFINNLSLREVRLSRNKITFIDTEMFKNIPHRCKINMWRNTCIHNGFGSNRATVGTNEEFFDNIAKNCSKV